MAPTTPKAPMSFTEEELGNPLLFAHGVLERIASDPEEIRRISLDLKKAAERIYGEAYGTCLTLSTSQNDFVGLWGDEEVCQAGTMAEKAKAALRNGEELPGNISIVDLGRFRPSDGNESLRELLSSDNTPDLITLDAPAGVLANNAAQAHVISRIFGVRLEVNFSFGPFPLYPTDTEDEAYERFNAAFN